MRTAMFKTLRTIFSQIIMISLFLTTLMAGYGWSETYQFITQWGFPKIQPKAILLVQRE
jgi:hypothetical protein